MKKNYVNSKELENWWTNYLDTGCSLAWEQMSERIYLICCGIATKFNPKSDEEYNEHVHDAFLQTMDKIKKGKLKFTPGRAPVFNLITTTIYRILYSKMNKLKKHNDHMRKYATQVIGNDPDALAALGFAHDHNKVHV